MFIPMNGLDRAILTTLEDDVLHPAIVQKALDKALCEIQADLTQSDPEARRQALQDELAHLEAELELFVAAIGSGGGVLSSVLAAVRARENRRTQNSPHWTAFLARPLMWRVS